MYFASTLFERKLFDIIYWCLNTIQDIIQLFISMFKTLKKKILDTENIKKDDMIIFYDLETTGLNPYHSKIIEIGAIKYSCSSGKIIDKFNSLINPGIPIPNKITRITGISDEMVQEAPNSISVIKNFIDFCQFDQNHNIYLVAHNNDSFDQRFLNTNIFYNNSYKQTDKNIKYIDTLRLAQKLFPKCNRFSLKALCEHYDIEQCNAHRAMNDAECLSQVYEQLTKDYSNQMFQSPHTYFLAMNNPKEIHQFVYY